MTGPGSSCGACKFLRRRCTEECVFAPYFSYQHAANDFAAAHRVFGASNVSKMLLRLPVESRSEAAIALSYEAIARIQNPKYGIVANILDLQNQVNKLKQEIEDFEKQMACPPIHKIKINELQFSGEFQNTTINDCINPCVEMSYLEDLSADVFCTQTTLQHEDETTLPSYDQNISDLLLDRAAQNTYLQYQHIDYGSIYRY